MEAWNAVINRHRVDKDLQASAGKGLGKLAMLPEAAGKVRVVAMVDA